MIAVGKREGYCCRLHRRNADSDGDDDESLKHSKSFMMSRSIGNRTLASALCHTKRVEKGEIQLPSTLREKTSGTNQVRLLLQVHETLESRTIKGKFGPRARVVCVHNMLSARKGDCGSCRVRIKFLAYPSIPPRTQRVILSM